MNYFKTLSLLILLSCVLVAGSAVIGGTQAAVFGLVFALVMNLGAYFWSDKIVLWQYGAREVSEADAPMLYRATRNVAQKMGMPMPRVCIAPSDSPNAFATGRNPQHAAVCATSSILELLDAEELEAVMAHEMSHVRNRDTLTMTVAGVLSAAITYLAHLAMWFGSGRRDERDGEGSAIGGILFMILAPFAAMLIQLAVSRSRETAADRSAAFLTGDPRALERALQKIHGMIKRVPMQEATPATAHLMIAPPFGNDGWVTNLFSTHPTLQRRIDALEEVESELHGSRKFLRPA